jgi:hypothetical protein
MLALFDYPDPNVHSERRTTTTTPSQKLFLLNSTFIVDNAAKFAERLAQESDSDQQLLERAYKLLYARAPTEEERQLGIEYLANAEGQQEKYLHALMVANTMLFIE